MKTTVIHHSADYDGIFCREIARKFLPDAELIGWDFSDAPLQIPMGQIYVLDLPVDRVFGFKYGTKDVDKTPPQQPGGLVWIDHHKSSIETHPKSIPGYRIDGVAACRLAWQWFMHTALPDHDGHELPSKDDFVARAVNEPYAVRLAGEYDIWDKRDPHAELFQQALRSRELTPHVWKDLLDHEIEPTLQIQQSQIMASVLFEGGRVLQYAKNHENESIIKELGFTVKWEGLTFLACNAARFNSLLFTAGLKPEHDACLGFKWTGNNWSVSLYHAPGKEHHDLSVIATKHGGGGHRGACGFQCNNLEFIT